MPHQIKDVVEQSIRLSKVAVAEPIEVKVRHRDGVDTFDDGVRLKVAGARGVMEIGGQIDCQVAIRCVKRGAIAVLGVKAGQVEKEVSVHVRGSEEDLAKLDRPPRLSISGDALQSTQQAAVAHAVGDAMDLCRSRPGRELHEEILAHFFLRFSLVVADLFLVGGGHGLGVNEFCDISQSSAAGSCYEDPQEANR